MYTVHCIILMWAQWAWDRWWHTDTGQTSCCAAECIAILYSLLCALYTGQCSEGGTVRSEQYSVYSTMCTIQCVQYRLYSTKQCVQDKVHSTLWTVPWGEQQGCTVLTEAHPLDDLEDWCSRDTWEEGTRDATGRVNPGHRAHTHRVCVYVCMCVCVIRNIMAVYKWAGLQ